MITVLLNIVLGVVSMGLPIVSGLLVLRLVKRHQRNNRNK